MTHLIFAVGGHAHVLVLEHLIKQPVAGLQVSLINDSSSNGLKAKVYFLAQALLL